MKYEPIWGRFTADHPEAAPLAATLLIRQYIEGRDERIVTELEKMVGACNSVATIMEFERLFAEGARYAAGLLKPGDAPDDTVIKLVQFENLAAKRKNELSRARSEGILLEDVPRPPKMGGKKIYGQLRVRRSLTYG